MKNYWKMSDFSLFAVPYAYVDHSSYLADQLFVLDHSGDNEEEWYVYDISGLLREYAKEYATGSPNNLLCTTTELRDCHYRKQENNAYYHIQAINLPFQNIEFYYLTLEQKNDKEAFHEF